PAGHRAPLSFPTRRSSDLAGAQEVGVQRMRVAVVVERGLRRRQRLAEYLAAEHVLGADVAALAAEEVVLEPFQRQQVDEFRNGGCHCGEYTGSRVSGTDASTRGHGNSGPGSRLRGTRSVGSSLAATRSTSRSSCPAMKRSAGSPPASPRSSATSASTCGSG